MLTDHKYQNMKEKNQQWYTLYTIQCTVVSCERPFSIFEMRTRLHSFQSHTSRREQEFLSFSSVIRDEIFSFSLMFQDKNENTCLPVSCFETRTRIKFMTILTRIFENDIFACFLTDFQIRLVISQILLKLYCM